MTVLPYILVSLVSGLGRLSYAENRLLALKGGGFVLLFWAIALVVTVLFTLSFPNWESATFFSTSLVESAGQFDLVGLYIPTNPFASLSNSVVPAIVLFSLAFPSRTWCRCPLPTPCLEGRTIWETTSTPGSP